MSDSDIIADVAKKLVKTVPIHARVPESDVALVDKAAAAELTSRSLMVARIIREWAKRMKPKK